MGSESDLSGDTPKEPIFGHDESLEKDLDWLYVAFWNLSFALRKSIATRKVFANWDRTILIKTAGGSIFLNISNGLIHGFAYANSHTPLPYGYQITPDLVLAIHDPRELLLYFERGVAFINLIMTGRLWVSKPELETITRFDRLPRTLQKEGLWKPLAVRERRTVVEEVPIEECDFCEDGGCRCGGNCGCDR